MFTTVRLCCAVLLILELTVHPAEAGAKKFMEQLQRQDYSNVEPPSNRQSTEINMGLYVNSFSAISARTMDYRMSFYLRLKWTDPRLRYNSGDHENKEKIRLEFGLWKKIWRPDVFFRNEKDAKRHDITVENTLAQVKPTGEVWYVVKYSATLSCPMNLQKYPFDTQTCSLMLESYGNTNDTMYFRWMDSAVDVDPSLQLPQFTLRDTVLKDCSQTYTSGSFPCLETQFVLHRDVGFFVMQVFLPTILVVAVSWLAFWFDPSAVTARGLVGLLTLLSLITQAVSSVDSLSRVSYVMAIHVWFSVCLLFVFGSLVELAVISGLARSQGNGNHGDNKESEGTSTGRLITKIDGVAAIAFPVAFTAVCFIFFIVYSA